MKTSNKYVHLACVLILSAVLLSWRYLNNSKTELTIPRFSYFQNNNFSELADTEISAYVAKNENYFSPGSINETPTAEDVLVQKIPGDNKHLLMMAFFSKENYSGPIVTLEDGSEIVFRDDGTGFDKKAGDGLYTARITEDIIKLRKQAVSLMVEMKKMVINLFILNIV